MSESAVPPDLVATVSALIELMGHGGITELDVSTGDLAIHLRGGSAAPVAQTVEAVAVAAPAAAPVAAPPANEHIVTAPMIGTFYATPAPGEAPFVRPGDHIDIGQTVGIIEAMKIMNEIAADRAGIIKELLVTNGQAVEYGTPLVKLTLGDQAAP